MLTFRSLGRFCRTKTYIDRFTALESEINRIEVEIIERQAELDKIQAIVQLSPFHNALKKIMNFLDKPYENVALNEEKQKAKQLYRQLQLLEDEGKSRLAIALKLKKEEEARREELFLTDLAKFSQQYHQTLQKNNFKNDIKVGLELSCKALDSILEKERVQWFGENNEIFDHEKHERVQGEGNKLNIEKVFEKGLIIRGNVIEKAKVK